ncbi:MAG: heparinase II/III family protein [Propionicimonas sp.]
MADTAEYSGPLRAAFASQLGSDRITAELLLPADRALACPPAQDRAGWALETGSADGPTLRDQVKRASADLDQPWPLPLASTATRLHRDGDRSSHEKLVLARQQRLSRATVAAAATGDPRFIDEAADGVWQLCEQSSWCWPAHDDSHARHGSVLPVVTDPYLDLGAGEVVAQLAWIDQLLGSEFDDAYRGLRARLRHEARVRIFEPFARRRDWHWLGLAGDVHNWNPWIHGNLLIAALRLLDHPEEADERARLVDLIVSGLDRYLAALPADGAIDEGYHYWWNGACRALEAAEVLHHATGGRLDALAAVPSLRATVAFPHQMQLSECWVLNLADGPARSDGDVAWDVLYRAAQQVDDPAAAAFAASHRRPGHPVAHEGPGLGRLLRAATDAGWITAEPTAPPLPGEVWLESIQVRLVREQAGSAKGLTLAVKGGHNEEHHNHNDIGEVVVSSDGVPVLVDAGRPTYTAATFGPDRYQAWMMQSGSHNVPLVRQTMQSQGREFRAAAVHPLPDGLALDLASAYPVTDLTSWQRTARLTDGRVLLHDAWQLTPWPGGDAEPATTVRFLIAGEVAVSPGQVDVQPLEGATAIRLAWPPDIPVTSCPQPLDDPMLVSVWGDRLTRIELDVTGRHELIVDIRQVIA